MNFMVMNMKNLRIAWLLPVAWFYWQPTLSEFTKLFPKTKIFTAKWPGYARGFEDSIDVKVVGKRQFFKLSPKIGGNRLKFTYLSPKIIGHLFSFKPHIIFADSFRIWTILVLLLKPLTKWKVIIAYEGSAPSVDYRNSAVRLTIRRTMVKAADACITNSQGGKAYLTEVLKADKSRVFAQPYEIPAAASLLENCENNKLESCQLKPPVFLFVGRLFPRKGLHLLLEACSVLQKQGYSNYKLIVVGEGEQREKLEAFCKINGLDESVKWTGLVDYKQVSSYFRAADVFILPTLEDTWGVVVLEAMLFGKAVLCSTAAGTSEMIADGENGYVFEPHQTEKIAELMCKFIDNPSLIEVMGKKSQQKISTYTPKAASESLAQMLELLDKQKK